MINVQICLHTPVCTCMCMRTSDRLSSYNCTYMCVNMFTYTHVQCASAHQVVGHPWQHRVLSFSSPPVSLPPASLTSFYFHLLHLQSCPDKHYVVILNVLTSLLCVSSQKVQMVFSKTVTRSEELVDSTHDLPLSSSLTRSVSSNLTPVHFCCNSLSILPKNNFEMKMSKDIVNVKLC